MLIGKAPHIAEFAWLNTMYPCLSAEEVAQLEMRLQSSIPAEYKQFLMQCSNGLKLMVTTFSLYGSRASYNRTDFSLRYPFNIEDIQKNERPKNSTSEMFFFGAYNYDLSKLYLNTTDNKVYYCKRYDVTPLKSWDSLNEMIVSEIERIYTLFDEKGHQIDPSEPTTPIE